MSNEVISNCKFCGATGVIVETPNKQFYPRCTGNYDTPPSRMGYCLLTRRPDPETDGYNTRELALAAWNRKPEPEPITAEGLERLGFVEDTPAGGGWRWVELEKNGKMVELGLFNEDLIFVDFQSTIKTVSIEKEKSQLLAMSDLLVLIKAFC